LVELAGAGHELGHVLAGWEVVDAGAEAEFDGIVEFDDCSEGDAFAGEAAVGVGKVFEDCEDLVGA
tara:strand:- start:119 stop:316 length:198 start_codon:yes stop_codon:yes gene_type:complete